MTFQVVIKTKRFLRKPLVETFDGAWKNEEEVRRVIARFRPKAEIIKIVEKRGKGEEKMSKKKFLSEGSFAKESSMSGGKEPQK